MSGERKLVRGSEVRPEPTSWLWVDRIPLGGVTLLEGDPADGKTTFTYDMAARLTRGLPMPVTENVVGPAGAVILQAEDLLAGTVRPALEAMGADLDRIMLFDKRRFAEKPLLIPDDISIVEGAIDCVRAKLVVFDPLPSFLGGSMNAEHSVRRVFGALAVLAEKKQVAIVVVRHLTKDRRANAKYRGSGSVSIIGAARSALMVVDAPTSDDPFEHVLVLSKSNLGTAAPLRYRTVMDDGVIKVEWLGECLHSASDLLEASADHFESSQLDEACYVLYSTLTEAQGVMPAKQVLEAAAGALVSKRTLNRAKQRLGVKSYRKRQDNTNGDIVWEWVWKLPANQAVLQPYRERAMREQLEDVADSPQVLPLIIESEETDFPDEHNVEPERNATDANSQSANDSSGRPWEDTDETATATDGVPVGSSAARPWDE